jgi:hypothetical protein
MSLENGTQVSSNAFEFDVFIKSTETSFTLTAYQCAFTFNVASNGGTLTFSYLSSSSQLTNFPLYAIGIYQLDGVRELTFASSVGSDNISSTSKKVGRFRLQNTAAFSSPLFEITWNFQGVINTLVTSNNLVNITNSFNHANLSISSDTTPPSLLEASASNSETVVLNFTEQLSASSSNNISNYSINNGIDVTNVALSSSGTLVTLTTSPHTATLTYTVSVNNVKDLAGNLISSSANSAQYLYGNSEALRINVKVFLQGPYSNGSLKKSLNSLGFIPAIQPYNSSPWNYAGLETVHSIPEDVVDWVLIELRSETSGSTTLATRTAFIKSDGSIVDLDGTSKVKIKGVNAGSYYVVIRHRNHLSVMSASKAVLSSDPPLYDFTTASNKAYGGQQIKLSQGVYGIYSGDGNGNGTINKSDENSVWKQQSGLMGYYGGDFDLNGGVNIDDKNIYYKPNGQKSTDVPN